MRLLCGTLLPLTIALAGCGGSDSPSGGSGGGGGSPGSSSAGPGGAGGASGDGGHGGAPHPPSCHTDNTPPQGFFAATDGTPQGDGSLDKPWDLATAFYSNPGVHPGDTVWIRGGVYPGAWVAKFDGTESAPVTVRSYPGEWATLDGRGETDPTLQIYHQYTVFRDFEVMNSDPMRFEPDRPSGIYVEAKNIQIIDLIVHDTGTGIICNSATDTDPELAPELEVYGSVLYDNGNDDTDRGHGHDLYIQNRDGTKHLLENILFNSFGGFGIHAYSDDDSHYVEGYEITGNVWFEAGAGSAGNSKIYDGCLVGHNGTHPVKRVTLRENMGWASSIPDGRDVRLGWSADNDDAHLFDNYFVGQTVFQQAWQTIEMSGNVLIGPLVGADAGAYPNNTYLTKAPAEAKVFVRPNKYQPGRANIVVYNWAGAKTVDVDVSAVLAKGSRYEVRNAQDYFAAPVVSGVYDGKPLALPMTGLSVAQPIGYPTAIVSQERTGKAFNVFVLIGDCLD